MNARGESTERFALRFLAWMFLGLAVFFAAETAFELWRSGVEWSSLQPSGRMTQALATTVSRAYNNLLAMVLSFVAIAVPITANMYTPRLIQIFFSDRVNLLALSFFAAMGAHAVYAQSVAYDDWAPRTHIAVLWVSGVVGFAVLIPYYLYVLDFLNPSTIIRRVRDRLVAEYACVARTDEPPGLRRRRLHDRILQLGNVILRAIDRADRDVAIDAISALETAVGAYGDAKEAAPPEWFEVEAGLFPGLSGDAMRLMRRERTWVEQRALSQLHLAFVAALAKMQDAVSAISLVVRRVALVAKDRDDEAVLGLAIRYLNTFLRAAIGRKDLHALFDLFYEVRQLAVDLVPSKPNRSAEIARHLRYYSEQARLQGLPFIHELGAAEVAVVVEAAYEAKAPTARAILDELRAFGGPHATVRLTKATAVLAAYFAARGPGEEAALLRADLEATSPERLSAARRDVAGTADPVFWEVTDRQTNLDYVAPERREAVVKLLDEVLARQS